MQRAIGKQGVDDDTPYREEEDEQAPEHLIRDRTV